MGRSVSYARGSIAKVYYDVSSHGYDVDDNGNPIGDYCQDIGQFQWEDFILCLRDDIKALWPSFSDCVEWIDREDHAILENRFAYIGVSEYCGLACLWLLPKETGGCYPEDIKLDNLAKGWVNRITPKFLAKFGELNKLGSFSNGEGVFERKETKVS